ncbi:hypothetical protein BTR14_18360 [Rhizobium rhizosphaerae]|uniref:Serine acetyltransferase n=2 Tax=Xaviernesmea rhizosphaerae TaxID=1672749 RepID=A0ABX3PA19_9HYPH|nr:hypothetical protein BTR14_18360 [Xaviernesmea rhizosphaerae]
MELHMEVRETPLSKIKADLKMFAQRERKRLSFPFALRMFLLTPGFQFVFSLRLQEMAARIPLIGRLLRRIIWWASCLCFSSEIAIGATVGGGFYTPHPFGIVVGTATIGRDVTILQNVTIGRTSPDSERDAIIGDGVRIYAGAAVLGAITLGRNAVVAANSVVLKDVPDDCVAIGAPATIRPRKSAPTSTAAQPSELLPSASQDV